MEVAQVLFLMLLVILVLLTHELTASSPMRLNGPWANNDLC